LGEGALRSIYDIQKEIAEASNKLNNLILEKKVTLQMMWGYEKQAKEIADRAIARAKETND
jgi:hypothetical protein